MITVSICCYLMKYQTKQLLPFHYKNNELRSFILKMGNKVKDIDIKKLLLIYILLFNDIINIKIFGSLIDKKSYKNILIYYIGYVTIKDSKYVKNNRVKTLYLIFIEVK